MGCGASKGAEAVVVAAPPQAKETEKCSQSLAAPTPPLGSQATSRTDSGKKIEAEVCDVAGPKLDKRDGAASATGDIKPPQTTDGPLKPPSIKTLSVMVIAEPQCLESDGMSERPSSAGAERPASAEPENPARTAFRARFDAMSPDDLPPSPIAFKSSRSLNRSIGVRKRISDQGSYQGSPPPPAPPEPEPPQPSGNPAYFPEEEDDDEEEDKGPDPLREQFELMKESNPLLVVGRKPTGNGILSCKASEKSIKSHRRLQFALQGDAAPSRPASGGGGGDTGGREEGGGAETERTACKSAWPE